MDTSAIGADGEPDTVPARCEHCDTALHGGHRVLVAFAAAFAGFAGLARL